MGEFAVVISGGRGEEIEALLVQTGGYSEAIRRTASVVHGHTQSVRAKLRAELDRRATEARKGKHE